MSEKDKPTKTKETERTTSVNRRWFMKTVGTASGIMSVGGISIDSVSASQTSSLAVSNLTSREKDQLKTAKQPYNTPRAAKNAIRIHGKQLLNELKQRGVITSISELHTDKFISAKKYANGEDGMGIISYRFNGVPTAHIHTSMETADQYLTVVVEPQLRRSYAILKESADDPDSANIIDRSDREYMKNSLGINVSRNCTASQAGTYCLWDGADGDPTSEDNCWLSSEVYNWYCTSFRMGCCYLGDFQYCAGPFATCHTGIDCRRC
jgi:hypothetical protein